MPASLRCPTCFSTRKPALNNRDSLGNRNLILPGGLHWTAAGRGVVHEEVPAETGKTVHMLQIFVNLTREHQGAAPFALSLAPQDVPLVRLPGVRIRVPLGSYGEAHSPLAPPTKVSLLDISLEDGAELSVPLAAGHNAFVMPIHGALTIDGQRFASDEPMLPVFPAQAAARSITLAALHGSAKAVLFAGPPLQQPVFWQGPLALASAEALAAAIAAYQRGEFGILETISG